MSAVWPIGRTRKFPVKTPTLPSQSHRVGMEPKAGGIRFKPLSTGERPVLPSEQMLLKRVYDSRQPAV